METNEWGGAEHKHNENAELLLDLLFGAMEEEGYTVREFSRFGLRTTAYGGIEAKRDGETFRISVDVKRR